MKRISLLALLGLFVASTHLSAQTPKPNPDSVRHAKPQPEVLVTGFPNTEGKTPAPIENIDRATLRGIQTVQDIPKIASQSTNVFYYSTSGIDIGYSNLNIRGIDQKRISVLVNGIPQNGPEDHEVYWIDMPDLSGSGSAVSIQRGAGSAFYGSPAIGGSVNVETILSPKRAIEVESGYGSYNTQRYAITANSGLIEDKYVVYARLGQTHTDGYRHSSFADLSSYFVSVARYDSNFSLQANFYGEPFSDGLNYYGLFDKALLTDRDARKTNYSESPLGYERRADEGEHFSQPHYELLTDWKINKELRFLNTFFYVEGTGYFDIDGTWASPSAQYYHLTAPYAARYGFTALADTAVMANALYRGSVSNKQLGWMPRLEIAQDAGKLTIAGEFRLHNSLHYGHLLSASSMSPNLPGDYHFYEFRGGKDIANISIAEEFAPLKDLNILGSVQVVNERYRFGDQKPFYVDTALSSELGIDTGFQSYTFRVPFTFFNPRLGVSIKLSEVASVFGSASYTTREPRITDYYNAEFLSEPNFVKANRTYDFSQPLVKPEHVLDLELGMNIQRLMLSDYLAWTGSINLYDMAFRDEIVKTDSADHFGASIQRNAPRSEHVGIELATQFEYQDWLKVHGSVSISRNRILEVDTLFLPSSIVGNTPIGVPNVIGNVGFTLTPLTGLFLDVSGRYVGTMYGDLEHTEGMTNDPYFIFDAIASYKFVDVLGLSSIEIKGQVNNIFNRQYAAFVSGDGFFVGAPRNFFGMIKVGI